MGKNRALANLIEDVRLHILSYCGFRDALSLMRITKPWYSTYQVASVWRPIYYNTFNDFNPKPGRGTSDWLQEIKNKIRVYGHNFDKYRHLIGNAKIRWKMDPPVDFGVTGSHIHKTLGIHIDNRLLPYMGYNGPNSVCYRDWIVQVFTPLFKKFDANEKYTHRWDFCDQAMPEFVFVKEGPICKLSICDGICGGKADPAWQNIEFLIEDLRVEYTKFLEELYEELITKYGNEGQVFWDKLGIAMSNDGKYIGEKEPKFDTQNWAALGIEFRAPINNNNTIMTLDNVPTDRHVIFDSSDSESSVDLKIDQSALSQHKIDKNDATDANNTKKRKSDSDLNEEKPAKKHKKEKKKSKDKHNKSKNKNNEESDNVDKKKHKKQKDKKKQQ